MNDFQVLGSAITYVRRYSLSTILGLVTDKDTDGSGDQEGKKPDKKESQTNNLPWLNFGKDPWNAVVSKAKTNTTTITEIKKHYKLSKVNEEKLIEAIK